MQSEIVLFIFDSRFGSSGSAKSIEKLVAVVNKSGLSGSFSSVARDNTRTSEAMTIQFCMVYGFAKIRPASVQAAVQFRVPLTRQPADKNIGDPYESSGVSGKNMLPL